MSLAFATASPTLFLEDASPNNVHRCTAATVTVQNIIVPIRVMDTIVITNCAHTVWVIVAVGWHLGFDLSVKATDNVDRKKREIERAYETRLKEFKKPAIHTKQGHLQKQRW
jgi:hypothetical protein